jgi:hypothetical protein
MDSAQKTRRDRGAYVGAALLILVGIAALIGNLGGGSYVYESIPFGLGLAFLVAYAMTRQYGFLVPGGILTGVGAGVLASSLLNVADGGAYVAIGGGAGFLLIFVVDGLVSKVATRWWPVIPGALMLVVGVQAATDNQELWRQVGLWSPALLILLGLLIIVARARRGTA